MRQYHRLMRHQGANCYTDVEQAQLFRLLTSAPGTKNVEAIEKHPKGGYRTRFDLSPDAIDGFIAFLEHHGWMLVV